MIRYYCSGFDINNAFGHGLGDMFKTELKDTKRCAICGERFIIKNSNDRSSKYCNICRIENQKRLQRESMNKKRKNSLLHI